MEEQQVTEANLKQSQFKEAKHREAKAHEAKLAEAKLMSISIAMIMAVTAMLGAVTAYRAALAEQETLRFERRLQQGQMLELVHRQELLSNIASRSRYQNSAAQHTPAAQGGQEETTKLTATDRRQAALKKLQDEEERAHVKSLKPYLDYFQVDSPYSDLKSALGMEATVAYADATWLRSLGFDTVWGPPENGKIVSMWTKLDDNVQRGRHKVMLLAVAVVLFVVALAFLTFAQLSHRQAKRENVLAWIGVVLAGSGLVIAMWGDRNSWKDFLVFTAGFAVLALIGAPLARKFHFAAKAEAEEKCVPVAQRIPADVEAGAEVDEDEPVHAAEVEPALFAGMRLHTAPVAHTFGRFVISMIAISAVLSALSGYFYSKAAVASSQAVSAALENQADLFRMNSRQVTWWNFVVGRIATAEDHHLRYEAARQRVELAKEDPALLNLQDANARVEERRKMLENLESNEPKIHGLMTGKLGPEQDIHFPRNLVIANSSHDPARSFARWSAANELSLGYQKEATAFLSLLTLFAIALYLLGQALGMGRTSAAFILVLFACGLVSVGILRGLFVALAGHPIQLQAAKPECRLPGVVPDNDLAELAAEHFARGWMLSESSTDDQQGSSQAAKEFACAVQVRPTFAAANLELARATNRASTPQLNEGAFVSLIAKESLGKVVMAEQQARDLLTQQGLAPPIDVVGDYGFDMYANGLVQRNGKAVEVGRQATVAAINLNPDNPMLYLNLGLAQLAEGQEKLGLETYRQALTMGEAGTAPFITNDVAMIGGAITDLDVLRQYCGGLNGAEYCKQFETTDLPKLKSELVAAALPPPQGRTVANAQTKITNLNLWGYAAGLGWTGQIEGASAEAPENSQDSLAVLWYAYSQDWAAWRVLPSISDKISPAVSARGYAFYPVLWSSDGRICLQSGRYRAEFYVNGGLAAAKEIKLDHENVQPGIFPDLNVALCYPTGWQPWRSQDRDAVWTRGYIADGHDRGAFIFSFFDAQQDGEDASHVLALRRAVNVLRKEKLTAGELGETHLAECAGLTPSRSNLLLAFTGGDGTSIAKAWTTSEGLVNVAVVVDKHLDAASMQQSGAQSPARPDCEILMSATTVRDY